MAIRKRPLENGSFREVIVIDGLIRIITIIRLFVNGNSDFKNLYREGGKRFVDIKERMANVGMTQVDMILELQKSDPIAYDFVDDIAYLVKSYKKRCTTYRKNGCYFVKEGGTSPCD